MNRYVVTAAVNTPRFGTMTEEMIVEHEEYNAPAFLAALSKFFDIISEKWTVGSEPVSVTITRVAPERYFEVANGQAKGT